jgi:hypothetical protein
LELLSWRQPSEFGDGVDDTFAIQQMDDGSLHEVVIGLVVVDGHMEVHCSVGN